MEAAHFVQHDHVERGSGCSPVDIPMHMEAAFIGAPVNQCVNEPAIVVESENHGCLFCEECIEGHLVHPVRMFVRIHQGHQVNYIDNPNLDPRDMLLQKP